VRTRPALHEAKDEAETSYYEAEAKKTGPEAMLASRLEDLISLTSTNRRVTDVHING